MAKDYHKYLEEFDKHYKPHKNEKLERIGNLQREIHGSHTFHYLGRTNEKDGVPEFYDYGWSFGRGIRIHYNIDRILFKVEFQKEGLKIILTLGDEIRNEINIIDIKDI